MSKQTYCSMHLFQIPHLARSLAWPLGLVPSPPWPPRHGPPPPHPPSLDGENARSLCEGLAAWLLVRATPKGNTEKGGGHEGQHGSTYAISRGGRSRNRRGSLSRSWPRPDGVRDELLRQRRDGGGDNPVVGETTGGRAMGSQRQKDQEDLDRGGSTPTERGMEDSVRRNNYSVTANILRNAQSLPENLHHSLASHLPLGSRRCQAAQRRRANRYKTTRARLPAPLIVVQHFLLRPRTDI